MLLEDPSPLLGADGSLTICYQFPPTLRVHGAQDKRFRRAHRDAEYGHQPGELNFWLPLTDATEGRSSLWVESEPGKGDMHQLVLRCGEMARFYGVHCHHEAPPNLTEYCRVSLDFRIAPAACYDREYQFMPNGKTKIVHNYNECTIPPIKG